jgi:hypothetical protein
MLCTWTAGCGRVQGEESAGGVGCSQEEGFWMLLGVVGLFSGRPEQLGGVGVLFGVFKCLGVYLWLDACLVGLARCSGVV